MENLYTYQQFEAAVENDQVASAVISQSEATPTGTVRLRLKDGSRQDVNVADTSEARELLEAKDVAVAFAAVSTNNWMASLGAPLLAAVVAWIIGIVAGIIAAVRQNKLLDRLFMGGALIGVSMPVFMTALVLQYLFAFKFKWFPVSGFDSFRAMVLPAIVLGWNSAGSIARMTRSNLVEIMQNDFIRTARAKGLLESGVIVKHALKNAMLPVVTMMALQVSSMLSGAVLTESVFGVPGIGRLAVNAIETRDMPLLQGTVIFTTILIIAGNLVADLLYNVLDPRIREGA